MAESDRGKVFSLKTNPQTHHLYATVSEESVIGITTAPIILCARSPHVLKNILNAWMPIIRSEHVRR